MRHFATILLASSLMASMIGCQPDDSGDKPQDCEPSSQVRAWQDADGDGDGDPATETEVCELTAGFVANGQDCDDTNAGISFAALEECDGIDQDCDMLVDDGLLQRTFYADTDGDGFGDPNAVVKACAQPAATSEDNSDCDDAHGDAYPGAPEVCDGYDNNCDLERLFDDADPALDATTTTPFYVDRDRDGFGDDAFTTAACANPNPAQFTDVGGDCNDSNELVLPGGPELCDAVDNNCDTLIDEDDPALDPAELTTFYQDLDGDGVGNDLVTADTCFVDDKFAAVGGDCDDNDPSQQGPTSWVADGDGDGVGAGAVIGAPSCTPPSADTAPEPAIDDCDDADPARFPGNTDLCGDGIDQDCSGADAVCGPIGSFKVSDGPGIKTNPLVYTCLDACALLFGGAGTDYQCSTSGAVIDNKAFLSGYSDATYCKKPAAEDFSVGVNYNCGKAGCAYSAYVKDQCVSGETNYCWPN